MNNTFLRPVYTEGVVDLKIEKQLRFDNKKEGIKKQVNKHIPTSPDTNTGYEIHINRRAPLIKNFTVSTEQIKDEKDDLQRKLEGALLEILER